MSISVRVPMRTRVKIFADKLPSSLETDVNEFLEQVGNNGGVVRDISFKMNESYEPSTSFGGPYVVWILYSTPDVG